VIGQAVSLLGAAMILVAYAANQSGRMSRDSRAYQALNLVGSVILAFFAWQARQLGLTVLEGTWALLSLYGLARTLRPAG
jgi:hypothetical protein